MSRNVIVIGGVALGPKAASRLKRLDPTANVTMIDENINISFGGCGIPYYVSGEINSLDALRSTTYGTVRTPEYFEHKGVHTLNQTRVTAIDRAAKTVTAKNLVTGEEKTLPYDRLIIATGSTEPLNTVNISDSTLQAVKKGMLGYTTNGGSVAGPFQNCVVSAGAKTGTAQIGGSMKNGVFVAFAPYDEPEIAVALVLEKADAGAVLATTAVDIINAYFDREDTASILPENQLIP